MANDDELRMAEQLRDAWDAFVEGRPLPADALDPSLGETIEHLQAMYLPPAPDPAFIETLGQDLMPTAPAGIVLPPLVHSPNGHVHRERLSMPLPLAREARPTRFPNAMAVLATAALVTLVLLAGFVALRGSRRNQAEERPVAVPVVDVADSTSIPATTIETLFAATLPAGQVPETGVVQFFLWQLSLDPRSSTSATPEGSCCQGPQFTHVLSGELTVHVDGPMQVFRGTDQILTEAEAPGTDVVLLPGDTVIHDFSVPSEYTNQGSTPVQVLNIGLYAGTALPFWSTTVHLLNGSQAFHQAPFPPGPVTVSLLQVTLPPEGEFPAPPPGSLDLVVGQDGDASVGKNGDGSLFNIAATDQTIYAAVVEPGGRPNLTP